MFNSISGTLTAKNGGKTASVFLECNGIEWEFAVSKYTLETLPPESSTVKIYTWLQHKEDTMRLFGFAGAEERRVFLELITVEGVGPAGALKILSNISAPQLAQALDEEDMSCLERAAGKKTAQKMMLKLKGKVTRIETDNAGAADEGEFADIISALADMGFDRKAAAAAVADSAQKIRQNGRNPDAGELEKAVFRDSIVLLS